MRLMMILIPIVGTTVLTAAPVVIDAKSYHLRSGATPEWESFAAHKPDGKQLDVRFDFQPNRTEATLFIHQNDVKLDWRVELNGAKLKNLFLNEVPSVWAIAIPPGTLRQGANTLSILPPKENDDITVGPFAIDNRPLDKTLNDAIADVQVTGMDSALPCRITVTDSRGYLAAMRNAGSNALALRPGVAYSSDGRARLGLLQGEYTFLASRGFEYSVATQRVAIAAGPAKTVQLKIRREVDTKGLVACDTHVHTHTYAKHGDASIEERMLTLAGEGIELPISTEHNMLADFVPVAKRMGVEQFFTPVLGCEVTTRAGHFNVFPIKPGSAVPDDRITDWPKLMQSIRATPGVQVAVLNHPRDVHTDFVPFAEANLNAASGENLRGFEFSFDAVELVNSGALRSDLMEVYRNWFSLLNHGYSITGVGASDSHDVSRFIVGQGRTYIACDDTKAGQIDVDSAMASLRAGRSYVSLGLLVRVKVDGRFQPGDLAITLGEDVPIEMSVLRPSWINVDRVELYVNGSKVQEATGEDTQNPIKWTMPRPEHDAHWVVMATGPGVTSPHWPIPKPYQPSSPFWQPLVLGSSNPVWIDGDGDGKFTPPRGYARKLVEEAGDDLKALLAKLEDYDLAVSVQAASLLRSRGKNLQEITKALEQASPWVKEGFGAYVEGSRRR